MQAFKNLLRKRSYSIRLSSGRGRWVLLL
uniref:Uncharacterized protein n=1 Tax=Arundo donax TaxID=35708 RepID=A0A0A9BT38_ARUDO